MKIIQKYWFLIVFVFPIIGFLIRFYIGIIDLTKTVSLQNNEVIKMKKTIDDYENKLNNHITQFKLHKMELKYIKYEISNKSNK